MTATVIPIHCFPNKVFAEVAANIKISSIYSRQAKNIRMCVEIFSCGNILIYVEVLIRFCVSISSVFTVFDSEVEQNMSLRGSDRKYRVAHHRYRARRAYPGTKHIR